LFFLSSEWFVMAFILIFHLIGGDFTIPDRHDTREACELAARHYVAESQRLVPDKDRRTTWTCQPIVKD
jgi:hypothetical protein